MFTFAKKDEEWQRLQLLLKEEAVPSTASPLMKKAIEATSNKQYIKRRVGKE